MSYRLFLNSCIDAQTLREKNRNAPENFKYCNGVCQDYLEKNVFSSQHIMCNNCRNLINLAEKAIKDKKITIQQFKENPMIVHENKSFDITIKKTCITCNVEKFIYCFEYNRKECKSCRALEINTKNKQAIENIIKDIENVKDNIEQLQTLILHIPKDILILVISHYKIGRKSSDLKSTMVHNVVQYFKSLLNPNLCKAGCGSSVIEQFSICGKCSNNPKKRNFEIRQDFIDRLDTIINDLIILDRDKDYDNYNKDQLSLLARKMGLQFDQKIHKEQLFDLINIHLENKLKAKKENKVDYNPLVIDEIIIETRFSDGYINATQLCKVAGKRFYDWNRLDSTFSLVDTLSAETGIDVSALIDSNKGGNDKYLQCSWIHPDLAVQLAQWLSPTFAIKVSRWIRELFTTGTAHYNIQKSNEELTKLQIELEKVKDEKKKVEHKHKCLLQKRQYYKLEKGQSFYIIKVNDNDFKVGFEGVDINERFKAYRTAIPNMKLVYLVYTADAFLVEQCMLKRYHGKKVENNHEFLTEINELDLIGSAHTFMQFCKLDFVVASNETIQNYNQS